MRKCMRILMMSTLALALLAFAGCSDEITSPVEDTLGGTYQDKAADVVVEDGLTRYDGVIGGTNVYALLVPDDWNGELVVYAHGFVDAGEPLVLPNKDNVGEIRDRIVSMGFAWAYCSYRENGLAVKDGAWATRRLNKKFFSAVKTKPSHTWLMGNSMGGLIGVELAETHPGEYDGLVTLNGMVGGTVTQLNYVGDVRLLFDLLYESPLRGTVINVPEDWDLMTDVVYPVVGAVQADPTGLGIISRIKQTPLPGRDGEELVESLVTAIGFNFRGFHDLLDRTGGACPIDNFETVYEPAAPGLLPPEVPAMINAYVQRYDRGRPTDLLFDRYYEPTGDLTIPTISVHNEYDPVVPLFHEALYAAKVAAMGLSHNLEQRVISRYAHTDFNAEEAATEAAEALMALRAKVLVNRTVVSAD
jgi:pimeloyl-ACP methyl ester carboxylesterase